MQAIKWSICHHLTCYNRPIGGCLFKMNAPPLAVSFVVWILFLTTLCACHTLPPVFLVSCPFGLIIQNKMAGLRQALHDLIHQPLHWLLMHFSDQGPFVLKVQTLKNEHFIHMHWSSWNMHWECTFLNLRPRADHLPARANCDMVKLKIRVMGNFTERIKLYAVHIATINQYSIFLKTGMLLKFNDD